MTTTDRLFLSRRFASLLPMMVMVAGCAASGGSLVRTNVSDGQGPLIAGCQNVSAAYPAAAFNTSSYLSTFGSAFAEGSMAGVAEGSEKSKNTAGGSLVRGGGASLGVKLGVEGERKGERVNDLSGNPQAFCRAYSASFAETSAAVEKVLAGIDYALEVSDRGSGTFRTGYTNRQHPMAAWRDRYEVTVDDGAEGSTVVRVYRWLYISRKQGTFNRAKSAGQNEAWILKQVAENLATK